MYLSPNAYQTLNLICAYYNRTQKNSFTNIEANIPDSESAMNELENKGYISLNRFMYDTIVLLTKAKVHAKTLGQRAEG